jgi:subtilisin family serine protease
LLDDLIHPRQDWRTSELGQQLIEYVEASEAILQARQPLVGIIDTGFAANHPDLNYANLTLGKDYLDGDTNPLLQLGEGNPHGTHVLGIIAATQTNGIGIDGIHDQAPIWLSRAVGSGRWAEALIEFVNAAKASGQPNAVVNLSFDLTQTNPDGSVTTRYEFTPQERGAIEYARQHGVLIVTAAGNDGGVMSVLGQASQEFDNIITVGAVNQIKRAPYSSYGAGLDIVAPGGTTAEPIISTVSPGTATMAGTSVAAAQVTGTISQVWAANPDLNYRQVIEILKQTAIDINEWGWDAETGTGLLNRLGAVQLAQVVEPEPYTPVAWVTPLTWRAAGQVTVSERATDGENGSSSRVTYDDGSYANIFYDSSGQQVGQDVYSATGQPLYSERGNRGTYFHYMPNGELVVLHVESFYQDEHHLVIQPVEVIFVDNTPTDLSDNPRFRIAYTDDSTAQPDQINLPTTIGTWDGVSFDFISKQLTFYFKNEQENRHELKVWYDERKANWYNSITNQWNDVTPPASTTPELPSAPQPGQGNVPKTAGAFDKTVVSNGVTTHYYTNGYLSVQPNKQTTWYTVGSGVPVVTPPTNTPYPHDHSSGGSSDNSSGSPGGNTGGSGNGTGGNPDGGSDGGPSGGPGGAGSGDVSTDSGTETSTYTDIRTETGTSKAGSAQFFFSLERTNTFPTRTTREFMQNQGNSSWNPDEYHQQLQQVHDHFASTQTRDDTGSSRSSNFSKGESQTQFRLFKQAGERHTSKERWEKGADEETDYSNDSLTRTSSHTERSQGHSSSEYYRDSTGRELINKTDRTRTEHSNDYTQEQSHYRDETSTEIRRHDSAQQRQTQEQVIEEFGHWTINESTQLSSQMRTQIHSTSNTDTETTVGTTEEVEQSQTTIRKFSEPQQVSESEEFSGTASLHTQTQTVYRGNQSGSGSSTYARQTRTQSQVSKLNESQSGYTDTHTKVVEQAQSQTVDVIGTIRKSQRFSSSSQSEKTYFGNEFNRFSTTTAGLSYMYSKTDATEADHWSLHISRAHAHSATEVGDESIAWSWSKTGLLSETGDDHWSESLSHTQQGAIHKSYGASIAATPDAISAKELNYSDELAAEILQLLEQAGDSAGADLSQSSYLDKLAAILEQTRARLDSEQAAQLQAQMLDLLAIGQLAEQLQCHALLDPFTGGLFSEAHAVQSELDAKLFATDFKWFVKAGSEDTSIKALLFPAKVLVAARTHPDLAEQLSDPQFTEALVALARSYAQLNPDLTLEEPDKLDETPDLFLKTLWQSQDETVLSVAGQQLHDFVQGIDEPLKLLQFSTTLLQAAQQTPTLATQKQDARFLHHLLELGQAYAALNPPASIMEEPLDFFLATLWQQGKQGIQKGAEELSSFFEDLEEPAKRLMLLRYERNLLSNLKLMPNLESKLNDDLFVYGTFKVGKSYATSKAILDPTTLFGEASKAQSTEQGSATAAYTFSNFVFANSFYTEFSPTAIYDNELYAAATLSGSPNPNDDPCFRLLKEIAELATELFGRHEELLIDRYDLYHQRYSETDPVITVTDSSGQSFNPGSYQGHQEKYEEVRKALKQVLDNFKKSGCGDGDAEYYDEQVAGLYRSYLIAKQYVEEPAPQKPDPDRKQRFTLPQWAVDAGVDFVNGVLEIPADIAAFIFALLMILVEIFSLPWRYAF